MIKKVIIFNILVGCLATAIADELPPIDQNRVDLANSALKKALELGGPDNKKILSLLKSKNLDLVEVEYKELFKRYKNNSIYESQLRKAYALFNPRNQINISMLDSWVKEKDSYIAYAARGIYKVEIGNSIRGTKYIKDTPKENIRRMKIYYNQAIADLNEAVKREPALMPVYYRLMQIAMSVNMGFSTKDVLEKAVKGDMRTYYARAQYMISLLPRWGGSYEDMRNFADRAKKYSDINPRLWGLQGEVYADIASRYSLDKKDYKSAVKYYSLAMRFGDRVSWLTYRGTCYLELGKKKEALADFNKILVYDKNNTYAKKWIKHLNK
jgi:tetratricopeptide (TPR) repeat protein